VNEQLNGVPSKDLGLQVGLRVDEPFLADIVGRLDDIVALRVAY